MRNRIVKLIGAGALIAAAAVPLGASAEPVREVIHASVIYTSHPGTYHRYWLGGPYRHYYQAPRHYHPRAYWSRPNYWRHHDHHRWDRRHDHDRRRGHDRDGHDRHDGRDDHRDRHGH
jgi:hypothetical protein